jgi:hypothetical protein
MLDRARTASAAKPDARELMEPYLVSQTVSSSILSSSVPANARQDGAAERDRAVDAECAPLGPEWDADQGIQFGQRWS